MTYLIVGNLKMTKGFEMAAKSNANGYGTVAKSLHWVTALLILVLLATGFGSGQSIDPDTKAALLRVHLPVAIAVLVLTLGRVIWWWRFDRKPDPAGDDPAWQVRVAGITHLALYLMIFGLVGSGISLSILSGLPDALFGAAPLPVFTDFLPRLPHGLFARLLAALVLLHAGAALFHHFVRRETTLRRMWFTRPNAKH